jgi:hypothetical protein
VPGVRALLCLLLAGLFLYNPFLGMAHTSGDPSVCHPARHRATVGAGELEHFAQPNGIAIPSPDVYLAPASIDILPAVTARGHSNVVYAIVVSPQAGFSSSLWFRPPPAV